MSEKRRFTIESPKKEEGGNVFGISVGTYRQNASEKVSVNLNTATLSQIDLLVDGGFYSNRSDFINQALRETLDRRRSDIDRLAQQQSESTMENKQWFLGVRSVDKVVNAKSVFFACVNNKILHAEQYPVNVNYEFSNVIRSAKKFVPDGSHITKVIFNGNIPVNTKISIYGVRV